MSEIIEPLKKTDSLEGFMRRQELILRQNEFYKRLMIIPVIAILVSVSVIAFNFTVDRQQDVVNLQKETAVNVRYNMTYTEELNLNTATAEMLDALPDIGTKKADDIVKMRTKMGGFRSVEDVLNVDGIGEKTLAKIQHMIYVETK